MTHKSVVFRNMSTLFSLPSNMRLHMLFFVFLNVSILHGLTEAGVTPDISPHHQPEKPGLVQNSAFRYSKLQRSHSEIVSAPSTPDRSYLSDSDDGGYSSGDDTRSRHLSSQPPRLNPSQMRAKQALSSVKAILPTATNGAYRAVFGGPLTIAGMASSACGSLYSLCKGHYKEAARRMKRVPDKFVEGLAMTTFGSLNSALETGLHVSHAAHFGVKAIANKAVGNDRPRKGEGPDITIEREKERGQRFNDHKAFTRHFSRESTRNSKKWSVNLIKP